MKSPGQIVLSPLDTVMTVMFLIVITGDNILLMLSPTDIDMRYTFLMTIWSYNI